MFAEKEKNAYRKITAPDSLRQKIIGRPQHSQRKKAALGLIAAVAACFVLFLSGMFMNPSGNILINGQRLDDRIEISCLAPAAERSSDPSVTVPIRLNVRKATVISASDGWLHVTGADPAREVTVSSPTEFIWEVTPQTDPYEYQLLITNQKGVQKVTLKYDSAKMIITKENVQ